MESRKMAFGVAGVALVAFLIGQGCATAPKPDGGTPSSPAKVEKKKKVKTEPETARKELETLKPPRDPSFTVTGDLKLLFAKRETLKILLAMDGDRYRIHVQSKLGQSLISLAGRPGYQIRTRIDDDRMEAITGEEANYFNIQGVMFPALLVKSLVNGAPPPFGAIVSASEGEEGLREVITSAPAMTLIYGHELKRAEVRFDKGTIAIDYGERKQKAAGPLLLSATLSFKGKQKAVLSWSTIRHNVSFPTGYFTFDEGAY